MRDRRRNSGNSRDEIATIAESMGFEALARLLRKGGALAAALAAEINAAVDEAGSEAEPEPSRGRERGLGDSEGWAALANLVPQALRSEAEDVQASLIAQFRHEAGA
jgi:hypothetical protein